jgi:hypothetical protein
VPMRIDQARQHDRVACVDGIGVVDLEVRPDCRNPRALHQHVAPGEIAQVGIKGEDRSTTEQGRWLPCSTR